jgi:hypothetical protein
MARRLPDVEEEHRAPPPKRHGYKMGRFWARRDSLGQVSAG